MSNADTLRKGAEKARKLIDMHILDTILIPMAKGLMQAAIQGRVALGHNMTGNTVNAYAVAVYIRGTLCHIETSGGSIGRPLRGKLRVGRKFYAGSRRWDGETQEGTFTAPTETSGAMEPDASISFIESYKAPPDGFTLVFCNGVEYAEYQENAMNIDVLTANFDYARMFAPSMFKPMPS